jgi:hypothetical protein
MTADDHTSPVVLQITQIRVRGANCTWCFNDAMATTREVDGVATVRASILADCIEVRHHDVPTAVLLDTLRECLHGYDGSSHECLMVAVEPEVVTLTGGDTAAPAAPLDVVDETGLMETLSQAMARLRVAGYVGEFSASPEGDLLCRSCGTSQAPESIEIRETVRFEGDSNPDDEAILLALQCADGCLGQFSAAFGPGTPPADVMMLQRLSRPGRGTAQAGAS